MADISALSLSGFELVDTPRRTTHLGVTSQTPGALSVDEFQEASPLVATYCTQVTQEEFHEQGMTETEKALKVGILLHHASWRT